MNCGLPSAIIYLSTGLSSSLFSTYCRVVCFLTGILCSLFRLKYFSTVYFLKYTHLRLLLSTSSLYYSLLSELTSMSSAGWDLLIRRCCSFKEVCSSKVGLCIRFHSCWACCSWWYCFCCHNFRFCCYNYCLFGVVVMPVINLPGWYYSLAVGVGVDGLVEFMYLLTIYNCCW